jgi:restriction endonuclease S subunit
LKLNVIKLTEIVSVQMGHTFRSSLATWPTGNVPVIQMKDITDSGTVLLKSLSRVQVDDSNNNHLVQAGDLVFRSRGSKTTSALVPPVSEAVVLSAPLFRLRINRLEVLPEYLNWYINQIKAQAYLEMIAEGSAQKMVSKENLLELPIEIPSVATQKKIVEIAGLLARERLLMGTIAEKREKVIGVNLARIIEGA